MATLVKQSLLTQEIKRRNKLLFIIPLVLFLFLLIIGTGLILTFQELNKNIIKNNRQIEKLHKELESYQGSHSKAQTRLYEDFNSLTKQIKAITKDLESFKSTHDSEKLNFSQEVFNNQQALNHLKEAILVIGMGIKNQRDELHSWIELIDMKLTEFTLTLEDFGRSQGQHRAQTLMILEDLRNLAQESFNGLFNLAENLETISHSQDQHRSQMFMSFEGLKNLSREGFQNFSNLMEKQSNNETQEMMQRILNLTESIHEQNSLRLFEPIKVNNIEGRFNISDEVVNATQGQVAKSIMAFHGDSPFDDILEEMGQVNNSSLLEEIKNMTENQTKGGESYSALILRKVYAIKEFANETYNNAINKWINPKAPQSVTNEGRSFERESEKKNTRNSSQLVVRGVTAVKNYIGESLDYIFGKPNSTNQEGNSSLGQNGAETFSQGNQFVNESLGDEQEDNETTLYLPGWVGIGYHIETIIGRMLNISEQIKGGIFDQESKVFLSMEPMFRYLDLLIENSSESKGENLSSLKKWKRNYTLCKRLYESIKESLGGEGGQTHKTTQKKFEKQVQKFMTKLNLIRKLSST